ncbi:MAG TPA: Mov34/MPN/PAD-1 family protein [Solirubrobacteraceae bacterium]
MRRQEAALKAADIAGLRRVSAGVVYPHVFANADREVGGVLVGRVAAEGSLPMVTGAIEALKADEQRATLTFTQDAWEHVHRTLDETFPEGTQIVGWYHSHPGFGIFLSEHDLFIHRNFFSGASQIAVVVDPLACTEGAFVWRDGQIEPLFERPTPTGWQAQGVEPRSRPARTTVVWDADAPPQAGYPVPALILAALVGVLVGLGGWSLINGGSDTVTTPDAQRTPAGARGPDRQSGERARDQKPRSRAPRATSTPPPSGAQQTDGTAAGAESLTSAQLDPTNPLNDECARTTLGQPREARGYVIERTDQVSAAGAPICTFRAKSD